MRAGLLALLLLVPLVAFGQAYSYTDQPFMALTTSGSVVASPSYLINEGFEEANTGGALGSNTDGYDSPLVFAVNGVNVNNKYTPALVENYSLLVVDNGAYVIWRYWPTSPEYYVYFQINVSSISGAAQPYIFLIDQGGSVQSYLRILGEESGKLKVSNGSATGSTVAGMVGGTLYHVWAHWKTDGTAYAGFTTDGTFPTGDNYVSISGGNGSTAARDLYLQAEGPANFVYDRFLVSTNSIGANP